MALLSDSLSVWEIGFRWAGKNPRSIWLSIPLDVQDHFRNMMDAILSAELPCESITLEKRDFEEHEKDFSAYYWIDDIYQCMWGHRFDRKLLRHAGIDRFDLKLWCERWKMPLPEFWFPSGWNLEYELPEDEIHPGHYYVRRQWTDEEWEAWKQQQQQPKDSYGDAEPSEGQSLDVATPENTETSFSGASDRQLGAEEKLRPSQHARVACQQIAIAIWREEPNRTIASVVKDDLIQKYGGGSYYAEATVYDWVKVVAPAPVRERRGRPKKGDGDA